MVDRFELGVRGGVLVTPAGRTPADIYVRAGKIAAFGDSAVPLPADTVLDAKGAHVLPGLVDVHAHHRDPGYTHKEDVTTATAACAAGGITTTFGMPNVSPPPSTAKQLAAMLAIYRSKAIVDWNVNASATVLDEIPAMAGMGIAAFKVFMVEDSGRTYPHLPGLGIHDHGHLLRIFEEVGKTDRRLMVHPHDQALMDVIEQRTWQRDGRDFRAYARAFASHDGLVWDAATALLLRLQAATGTPFHLLHVQSQGMLRMLAEAKRQGQDVTGEVNSWALFLGNDWANIERLGPYALSFWIPPPHAEALWEGVRDGSLNIVSSDHTPHTREEKEPGWIDGWKSQGGTPSAQFLLPLLLDAVWRGELTLERLVEVSAAAPARAFRLGQKGRIALGADADLVVVDLDRELEVADDIVLSRCGWTPYAGRRLHGRVRSTLVRGRVLYDGQRVDMHQVGWGRQARPTARMAD
jgi:dihydroorotase